MSKQERLDQGFALFNGHINGASDRAKAEFIAQFGQKTYDKHIKPYDERGIMSIFEEKPKKWTFIYVTLVTAFVNEDRDPIKELLVQAFLKGWEQSGEGYNHEYHDSDTEKAVNRKAKDWARRQIKKLRYPKD